MDSTRLIYSEGHMPVKEYNVPSKTIATWNPSCGEGGPHGLAVDGPTGHLFVARSALAEVLFQSRLPRGIRREPARIPPKPVANVIPG